MVIINHHCETMENTVQRSEPMKYQDLKGMRVMDADGKKFGNLQEILIDPATLTVTAIMVHKGFKNVLVEKEYIERIGGNCVMLKIPIILKSMEVMDINGEKVGKVKQVFRGPANEIELIEVSTGMMSKTLRVPQQEIHGIGEKVVLRHTKEEYEHGNVLT